MPRTTTAHAVTAIGIDMGKICPTVSGLRPRERAMWVMISRSPAVGCEVRACVAEVAGRRPDSRVIGSLLSERHGRDGAVDLVHRPEGDGPGR